MKSIFGYLVLGLMLMGWANVVSADNVLQPIPDDVYTGHGGTWGGQTAISPGALVIDSFETSNTSINPGESVTLSWSTVGATSVFINPSVGLQNSAGSLSISPTTTTIYTLVASNSFGSISSALTVVVNSNPVPPLPEATITASSGTVAPGESFTLSWSAGGGTTVTIDPAIGQVPAVGSQVVSPTQTTTYTITVTNAAGSVSTSITVVVAPSPVTPVATITASNSTIAPGESFTLSWNNTGADTVSIDQGIGQVSSAGSRAVSPEQTTTYTIAASNAFKSVSTQITVIVAPPSSSSVPGDYQDFFNTSIASASDPNYAPVTSSTTNTSVASPNPKKGWWITILLLLILAGGGAWGFVIWRKTLDKKNRKM